MFFHNFKYQIKYLFKNKTLIFWTYAFPLILGLLFYMAFSDIDKDEAFKAFDIGVINNNEYKQNQIYNETFKELSNKESNNYLFNIKYLDNKEEAEKLLKDDEVCGYLYLENNKPTIQYKTIGVEQSIFKSVIEEIEETSKMINDLIPIEMSKGEQNINQIVNNILTKINETNIIFNNKTNKNISYITVEYFTLIAMASLYASMISMQSINQCLANMSNKGKRMSIAPTKKSIIVISSALASFLVSLIGMILLLIFILGILKINFDTSIINIILLSVLGTLSGVSLGLVIASCFKVSEGSKIGISLAYTMTMSFLAGMTGVMLKYMVDQNLPLLNKINPVNMITDGFYSLYYFDTLDRFKYNLISLGLFTLICLLISFISLRREKYDSI